MSVTFKYSELYNLSKGKNPYDKVIEKIDYAIKSKKNMKSNIEENRVKLLPLLDEIKKGNINGFTDASNDEIIDLYNTINSMLYKVNTDIKSLETEKPYVKLRSQHYNEIIKNNLKKQTVLYNKITKRIDSLRTDVNRKITNKSHSVTRKTNTIVGGKKKKNEKIFNKTIKNNKKQ